MVVLSSARWTRASRPTSLICIPCTSSDKTQVRSREERKETRRCNGVAGPEVEAFLLLMCVYTIYSSLYVGSASEVGAFVGVFCCKVVSYICRNAIFYFRSPNLVSHSFLHWVTFHLENKRQAVSVILKGVCGGTICVCLHMAHTP